uniref:Bacterial repeat domain-containing protein n=1 Tax=Solibacter usitatus (strain Ellin6076) TaxID=234267 RepID=Q01T07_SOLUE
MPNQPSLSQTPNGWRLDGVANEIKIRKSGQNHTITQTFPDLDTKHESTLSISFPSLVYDKDLSFHYTDSGVPWTVRFDQTGAFDFFSTIAKRQGRKTYTHNVSSSEALSVDAKGNLAGGSHVDLTRAVMIPKFGKAVPCTAWTYAKNGDASFTCDDSALKDNQFPYQIDPSTHTMTDPGTYHLDAWQGVTYDCDGDSPCWNSGGNHSVDVSLNTAGFMQANATFISAACRYDAWDVSLTDGNDLTCKLGTGGFNNSGTTIVHVGIGTNSSGDYSDSATVGNVGVAVVWDSPAAYSFSVSSQNPLYVGNNYQFYWNSSDPDGDQIQPEILITGTGGVASACRISGSGMSTAHTTWFADDNGNFTAYNDPFYSNDSTVSNSQCTDYKGHISGACYSNWCSYGADLVFTGAFVGTKSVYMKAFGTNEAYQYVGQVVIQLPSISVTVTSAPAGRNLTVDGSACTAPCSFTWISGSSHTIATAGTQAGGAGTQYVFSGWSDGGAASHTFVPSAGTYTANFTTQYYLTSGASPSAGGAISPSSGWYNAGSAVSVSASANGGYQFSGFSGGLSGTTTPQTLTMNAPANVTANYSALSSITVTSVPAGRSLTVDSNACTTPCGLQWVAGSNHTIATTGTQAGGTGTQYVFANWSDAGAASHAITTPSSAATYTANFTTQYSLTTSASPASAGSITPASAWYNSGSVVSISATANANYQFSAFSGGLSGTSSPQSLTMSAPATVTANFNVLQTITSVPAGLALTIDGGGCTTPCTFYWSLGSSHTVATAATQAGPARTQYVFSTWTDGGALSHSVTAPSTPSTFTANFGTQYYLTASAGTGGSIAPASGWYNSGVVVTASAAANAGYQFTGFSGGLTGATTPQSVTMSGPVLIIASFAPIQTVVTSPVGLSLTVDGVACTAPCSFTWAPASNHTIAAAGTIAGPAGTQYLFASWSDSGAASHSITAPSTPATYTASFATQYYFTSAASPSAGGSVSPASAWYNAGAVVAVSASTNGGYVFSGFSGSLSGPTTPQSVTMSAPATVTANFAAVIPQTITSVPAGLAMTIDGSACTAPCNVQWTAGSSHTIATTATQAGVTGTQFLFTAWSDTGALSHSVTAPATSTTYTATFTTQYYLTTSAGAGGSIAPASGWYNTGAAVPVSATATGGYQFTGFSGALTGSASPQNLTMSAAASVTAAFAPVQTVTSNPAGLSITVDGTACITPCTFAWVAGSAHTLAASAIIAGLTGSQSVFVSWSQGSAASQSITAAAIPTTYTVNYKTQYYLTTNAGPGGSIAPASAWFDSGTVVNISATADSTHYISGFTGDLTGTVSPQTVSMTAAKSITVTFGVAPTTTVTTSPGGLQLTVDGVSCTAPCGFQWAPGTNHTLAAATQSVGTGSQYAFQSWSQGGLASQTISATSSSSTYTAAFALQYYLTTAANPAAGGSVEPASGWYDSGAVVPVNAIASMGYQFTGFSNALAGTTVPQNLTITAAASVTANFQALPTTTIQSLPAGLTFTVDNVGCASPCLMQWAPGTSHTISAGTQVVGGNTQYVFASWSQGSTAAQTITATSANFTYTATFTAQYAVSTSVGPSAAGSVILTPASGWYAAGTQVTAGAVVNPGWAFTGFTGALNGAIAPQVLTVNAPVSLTANFTPDFSIAIPVPVSTTPSATVQFILTLTGQSGFSDTVTLDAPLLPTGAAATFNPATITAGGTSTVTLTAPSTGSTFAFTLRGTASSGLAHGVAGSLALKDFGLTPITDTASATPGNGASSYFQWAVNSINGFNSSVEFNRVVIVADATNPDPNSQASHALQSICSFSTLSGTGGTDNVTLNIAVASSCNSGSNGFTYPLLVSFWDSAHIITHNVIAWLNVTAAGDFSITVTPPNASVALGATVTYTLGVHGTGTFNSGVTFTIVPPPCGSVVGSPAPQVLSGGYTTFQYNTTGCSTGSTYPIHMTGTTAPGYSAHDVYATLSIGTSAPPDFSIMPSPSTQTVLPGAGQMYTLNVASINGFSQTVSVSVSGLPAGVTASFPAGPSVNGSGTLTLRLDTTSSAVSGSIPLTLTASGGGWVHAALITLVVQAPTQSGFSLGSIPPTNVTAGGAVVSVPIQVTPLNNGSTAITLRSVSTLPVGMNVVVSGDQIAGYTMTVSATSDVAAGTYFVELQASEGGGCGGPIIVASPGGGGTAFSMYLQVPTDIAVPNNNQAARIGPYYAYSNDGTPAQQQKYPASMVQYCSAGPGISVVKSWPSQSAPSDANLFDLVYTVSVTTVPGTRVVSCQVAGYLAIPPLSRPGVSVSCGTPTVSISPRPITLDDPNGKAPYYATLTAQGAPNGLYYTWSTNNSGMIEFDDPHASTVRLTIKRSGQATISVDAQNLCGNHASDSFTFVVSDDITVISWIDGQPIQLPGEASATVAGWMTDPIQCHLATLTWAAAGALQSPTAPPYDVGAPNDILYINAYMYKNSADPPPPQSLTDSERDRIHSNKSLYRGFSRFQAYYEVDPAFNNALASTMGVLKHDADVGATPDFCLGGYLAQEGEAHIRNKTGGIRPDYAWWLNEFRVGTLGQNANAYLNKRGQDPYTAMPWVWALIQLDKNGKVVPLIQGTQGTAQIFPTYWVYSFDVLTQTVSQLGIQSLIALDGTSSYHE